MIRRIIRFLRNFSLTKIAYKAFLKDIQHQLNHIKIDGEVSQYYVLLEKKANDAVAFVIKQYYNGKVTRTKLNAKIDIELLPLEIVEELNEEGICKLDMLLFRKRNV